MRRAQAAMSLGCAALWAILILGSARAASTQASRPTILPMIYEDGRVYVPVSAGKTALRPFILDTGWGGLLVDSFEVRRLGLDAHAGAPARGAGAGTLAAADLTDLRLDLGSLVLRLPKARSADLDGRLAPYGGRHIGGVVGGALFAGRVVVLDFPRRRVEVSAAVPGDLARARRVPYEIVGGTPIVEGALVFPDGHQEPLRLMLDLGAKAPLLVSEPFAARTGLLKALGGGVVAPLGAGVGGETRYAFARMPSVRLGAEGPALSGVLTGVSVGGALRGGAYDALVGAPFLAQYGRIAFDGVHNQLLLLGRPERDGSVFDASGLFLVAEEDGLRVTEVAPGSAAAEAGIGSGDELEAVDSVPTARLGLAAVRSRLSAAGARVDLTIRRGTAERIVRLALRGRLPPAAASSRRP
jgi:hypothetical protein